MWNYRVVRRKNVYVDSNNKEKVTYTYAIHEAYYDNNGHAGAITQGPIEPLGENIEELRHAWIMMAEAFGLPILDYDNIPEPGYERKKDPIESDLDERVKEMKASNAKGIPWKNARRELEEKFGPFDEEAYEKDVEEERLEKEKVHSETFVGTASLEQLIKNIFFDYREYIKRDKADKPWKYSTDNEEPGGSGQSAKNSPASD